MLLLIGSLAIAACSVLFFPRFSIDVGDSAKYHAIATSLVTEHAYPIIEEELYAPGYPLFLSAIYSTLGTSQGSIIVLQGILLGGIALAVFCFGIKFFLLKPKTALLASGMVLFWPYFILYANLVMSEILFIFVLFIALLTLWHSWNVNSIKHTITAGILFAIATLIRPVALLLPVWLILGSFIIARLTSLQAPSARRILIFFAAVFLTLSPWIIYSSIRTESITPVATNLADVITKFDEPEHTALDTLKQKSMNLALFWNPGAGGYQADAVVEKFGAAKYFITLYKIVFFILLLFAGLAALRKTPIALYSWLCIGYFWAVHTVLFPYPRYALPAIPFVILLSIYYLQHMIGSKKVLNQK